MRLTGHIVSKDELTQQDRQQMFELLQHYYENVVRDDFECDLDDKQSVIVAREPSTQCITGFSTQCVTAHSLDGETVRVLFSGDTIIDQSYWGRNPLAQLWGRMVLSLIDECPNVPIYWFLISKGYKTYRFLPVFFHEFYPRHDVETPGWAEKLVSTLATERFGDRFDKNHGIVAASPQSCRLRPYVADVTPQRLRDPHVAFFDRRNPLHAKGDELCCIAPLTKNNFTRNAFRVIGCDVPVR